LSPIVQTGAATAGVLFAAMIAIAFMRRQEPA
jgi:hypothetical protein